MGVIVLYCLHTQNKPWLAIITPWKKLGLHTNLPRNNISKNLLKSISKRAR